MNIGGEWVHMRLIGYHVVVTKEYKKFNSRCQKFDHAL
jgi:hypothetical protein